MNNNYEMKRIIKTKPYYNIELDVLVKKLNFELTDTDLRIKYFNSSLLLDLTLYRILHSFRNTKKKTFDYVNTLFHPDRVSDWSYYTPFSFNMVPLKQLNTRIIRTIQHSFITLWVKSISMF